MTDDLHERAPIAQSAEATGLEPVKSESESRLAHLHERAKDAHERIAMLLEKYRDLRSGVPNDVYSWHADWDALIFAFDAALTAVEALWKSEFDLRIRLSDALTDERAAHTETAHDGQARLG